MKQTKNLTKKVMVTALALTIGSAAQASVVNSALKSPLFSLKEIGSQSILIAHGKDGNCGEGKCGGDGKEAAVKEKSAEAKCAGKKDKKAKKAKKKAELKEKSAEGKCGADKAGEGKCGANKAPEAKCGEGKCGADKAK